jgi:hypothetical protein
MQVFLKKLGQTIQNSRVNLKQGKIIQDILSISEHASETNTKFDLTERNFAWPSSQQIFCELA